MLLPPNNPIGITGIEFVEFATSTPHELDQIFTSLGFACNVHHRTHPVSAYQQNEITFLINAQVTGFAADFAKLHGSSVSAIALGVQNVAHALAEVSRRGATVWQGESPYGELAAVFGLGKCLIYLVETGFELSQHDDFETVSEPLSSEDNFVAIDHLTYNVTKGTLEESANFFKDVFGFREIRQFAIRGEQTGLTSYALASPCGTFSIPVNEGDEEESQIEDFLRRHNGPGVQHLALQSRDLVGSFESISNDGIKTLPINGDYYESIFERFPQAAPQKSLIRKHNILIDGNENGHLLQVFTRELIGPIFFEGIERHNFNGFGEGNFGSLFKGIEEEQRRRSSNSESDHSLSNLVIVQSPQTKVSLAEILRNIQAGLSSRLGALATNEQFPYFEPRGSLLRPVVAWGSRSIREQGDAFWYAALAVQMAHEASLVHDDILDEAIERRGRPTFVAKHGAAAALLQGDHLLTAAYNLIARTKCWPLVELFAKVGEKTVAGEKLQALSRGKKISLEKNQAILEGKTGELFGFSMAIRPMLENNPNAHKYYLLGRRLGALYQMLDDVIDYCPNAKSGKPPYQDYKQHKWTWPLLALDRPTFDLSLDDLHTRLFASSHSDEPSALRREFRRLEAQHLQFKQEASDLCGDGHTALLLADEWLTRAEEAIRHEEDKFRFSFDPPPIAVLNQPVLECAQ